MPSRRQFLRYAAATGTSLALPALPQPAAAGILVNDIHSQLNATEVDRVVAVDSESALRIGVGTARAEGKPICIAGGRHAMGGQQFAQDACCSTPARCAKSSTSIANAASSRWRPASSGPS